MRLSIFVPFYRLWLMRYAMQLVWFGLVLLSNVKCSFVLLMFSCVLATVCFVDDGTIADYPMPETHSGDIIALVGWCVFLFACT